MTLANGVTGFSVAATTGLVAYRAGEESPHQLTWVDRSGTARGTIGDPDATLRGPRVSPNGRRVAVTRRVQGNDDIWLLDGARLIRFTFEAESDDHSVWSPDDTRIVYMPLTGDLKQKLSNGAGGEERLGVASGPAKSPTSWPPDGRFVLYSSNDPQASADLWVLLMVGDHTPTAFLKTPFREAHGAFSPDGRWVASHSNESGRNEIYVRPFVPPTVGGSSPVAGGQWQVSTAGGMMAAPITVSGASLEPGAPVVLFSTRIYFGDVDQQRGRQYDIAPDGRFLVNMALESAAAPTTLIQNWNPEAKK